MPRPSAIVINKNSAEIYIYNDIDPDFGFSSAELVEQLRGIKSTDAIDVHINSVGGSVFEGLAIYNLLRHWKGHVTTYCDGIAGSIASLIFLAGDERIIEDNAMVMIHNPLLERITAKSSKDLESKVELLKKTEDNVNQIYQERTGQSEDIVKGWMGGDTFLSSSEAVSLGLATKIVSLPEIRSRANLKSLAARLGATKMPGTLFNTWLKDYCDPLGIDTEKLTKEQRDGLQAKFDLESKGTKPPPLPGKTKPTDDDEDERLINRRRKEAEEEDRVDAIRAFASRHGDVELNEEYLKAIKVTSKTIKGLSSHAIREGWTVDRFELEMRRAERHDMGHVSIHSRHSRTDERTLNIPAMTCALLRSANVPSSKTHKWTGNKYGLEHWFKPEELEASDAPHLRNLGLHQILDMAIVEATGSRYNGRTNTDGFINACRDALFSLRMSANTTWTGLRIFDDAANKMLLTAYQAQNTTWQEWVYPVSVNDFKTSNIYRLTVTGGYQQVGADGALKHGGFSDDKFTLAANTYGKIVGLSRRDIINDDMSALDRVMTSLGVEGARFLEELFYMRLMDQLATLFPVAGTLFNYLSGATTTLTVDGLTQGEQLFADQTIDNAPIMTGGSILLVPTILSVKAAELYTNITLQGVQSANTKGRPDGNPHVGKFRPVVSGYLNNTNIKQRIANFGTAIPGQSNTHWLILASPQTGMGGIVNGAFLNGRQTPTVEQGDPTFDVLGLQWRAYHDAGAGNGDPKLGIYSKGAA